MASVRSLRSLTLAISLFRGIHIAKIVQVKGKWTHAKKSAVRSWKFGKKIHANDLVTDLCVLFDGAEGTHTVLEAPMRKIFTAKNPTEAEFVRGILESVGISAEVRGSDLWTARAEIPTNMDAAPSVWIEDDTRMGEAEALLADFNKERPTMQNAPAWTCPHCSVLIEGQFTECWKCGAERPE